MSELSSVIEIISHLTAFLPTILSNFGQLLEECVDVFHLDVDHVPESSQVIISGNMGIFYYGKGLQMEGKST